jgi:nicotinate-nucleotide adenylyltransferase
VTADPVLLRGNRRFAGRRIGLLGGSFNPAHEGHRHISMEALKKLDLDAVWWLVSPQNPLKPARGMAPQAARVSRAAEVDAHPAIFPTAIESRFGSRYTIDTLKQLCAFHPRARFIWLMGGDSLADFHRWKDWQQIARLMPIAVLPRPGYEHGCWSTPAAGWFGKWRKPRAASRRWHNWRTPALVIVALPLDSHSATALRAADPHWSRRYGDGAGNASDRRNSAESPSG